MTTWFRGVILALAVVAAPAVAQQGRLTVTGEGSAEMVPDRAEISIAVAVRAKTAEEALAMAAADTRRVLDLLGGAGVPAEDLQSRAVQLYPDWRERPGELPGAPDAFIARSEIGVTIRALDDLGPTLDAVVSAGVSEVSDLRFEVSDPAAALAEARAAAVADARARATTYAEAAGVTLGALLEIREGGAGGGPVPMLEARMAMDAASMPVAPGQVGFGATVTLVYGFD